MRTISFYVSILHTDDLLPPLVSSALNTLEVVCVLIALKLSAYTSMCIIVWSLGSLKFLVTSWQHTVIIDIIVAPIFVMPNGFPVTIFRVLQFPLFVAPTTASGTGTGTDQLDVSFNFCFSISCFNRCSISFVARSCFTLLMASAAALSKFISGDFLVMVSMELLTCVTAFTVFVGSSAFGASEFLVSNSACLFLVFCTAANANLCFG